MDARLEECAARRLQLIVAAHSNPTKPDWSQARYFTNQQGPEDCVDPVLKAVVNRRAREDALATGRGQGAAVTAAANFNTNHTGTEAEAAPEALDINSLLAK